MNADEGRGDKVPDGASGGCEDGVLGKILSQVQKLDLIEKKLDRLETIEREVTRIKTDLQEYKESLTYTQGQLADACEEVESLKLKMQQNDERVNKLESMVLCLEGRNKDLESKIVWQEAYSRRENVLIDGIRESHNENCTEKVQQLFRDMGVGECELQRCHRIGIRSAHQTRPRTIITRFVKFGDKMKVMKNGNKLSGKNIYVNDDYPQQWASKRASLRPVLKLAKETDQSATLVQDKLRYKDTMYTTDTVRNIPLDLNDISQKTSGKYVLFKGQYSILSKLYPCTLRYNNTVFNSFEQLYQYRKSSALGQHEVAANVMCAQTPYEAMKEGKAAKASDQWTASTGRDLMVDAVVIKYQQCSVFRDYLLRHKGKCFVEATNSKIWGSGVDLTSTKAMEESEWKGQNLMGKILRTLTKT